MGAGRTVSAYMLTTIAASATPGCSTLGSQHEMSPLAVIDDERRTRPPFQFSEGDDAFLEEVQKGAFAYLWNVCDPHTGMVFDRSSAKVISVAGVGFQLSALCIAVERGWVTRQAGEERALRILRALDREPSNRHAGLFYHYLEPGTAKPTQRAYETVVSTIDSALLLSGMATASVYFGGESARLADGMLSACDWSAFVARDAKEPWAREFISLGWAPNDKHNTTGPGKLLPYYWADAGDEQKLVTFLAVGAEKGVPPQTYYKLRRQFGDAGDGPLVWFPWSGALFTTFFAHCWIDYRAGPDDPASLGVTHRPRVDWWESSRRSALLHRRKAIENPRKFPGFNANSWGLGASDAPKGYQVSHLFPPPLPIPGARPGLDDPQFPVKDDWGDGTIAPYNAGCAIMFAPELSLEAMRGYTKVTGKDGTPLWKSVDEGGMGFQDAFNAAQGWIAPDCVAIDQGPLVLAIENARTGLVWRLFAQHAVARRATEKLKLPVRSSEKMPQDP